MNDLIKLDTGLRTIAGGALAGAAAGHFIISDWKKGAMLGAIVAVVLPTGQNIADKVIPASK